MTSGLRARRAASALLLCALAVPAVADGDAPGAPSAGKPAPATRRPPPMVLVVPLGVGVLLPLTLPTTLPRTRTAATPERPDGAVAAEPPAGPGAPPRESTP